ncbi:polygalacturonase-like [Magnolia sinica]|uniref:polygalacturonase-like n=1 Tax=Magnolia sinica TaxID=86752 RepID=UPI00265A4E05|nr:polygalacturonase-like [Magnolia sinica]
MARRMNYILSPLLLSLFISVNGDLSVTDYGAIGDGKTDASQSFLKAWTAACHSSEPTTIYVPRKRYQLRPVIFQGPCNNTSITIRVDGILVAPNYQEMGIVDNWIMFSGVQGVSINGNGGYLDGQGLGLWACKAAGHVCPAGTTSLAFFSSKDVSVSGITSINSELYHIVILTCNNVTLDGVRIYAPDDSPNTDGIHVQDSTNVRILSTGIKTGDDCISIGPGTQNLWIQRVACGPGHGISIGSLGKELKEDGVQNVTVKTVVFNGTLNGLRIKSWARPSYGFVKGVVFEHATMINVANPIIIDQNYCPNNNDGCPGQESGVKISQVTYKNIKGTSTSQVAMKFDCSSSSPCQGIRLQDIKLTYHDQLAESFCQNIKGSTSGLVVPPSCF